MNKNILISVALGFAASGAMANDKYQSKYDEYFDNQEIIRDIVLGSFKRDGEKHSNLEDPLKSDHEACLEASFQGVKLYFGDREISDPYSLLQFSLDNKLEVVTMMLTKKDIDSKFTAPDFKKNLKTIVAKDKERKACLQQKGWSFARGT